MEAPMHSCGSRHWRGQPCPASENEECAACKAKDQTIAELRQRLEALQQRNANPERVTLTVTRTNAERQRAYRQRKKAKQ